MADWYQPPYLTLTRYHCPHCGELANFATFPLAYLYSAPPTSAAQQMLQQGKAPAFTSLFYQQLERKHSGEAEEFALSLCDNCHRALLWVGKALVYPSPALNNDVRRILFSRELDLPEKTLEQLTSAVSIIETAPPAAAAMLRGVLYALSVRLGYKPDAADAADTLADVMEAQAPGETYTDFLYRMAPTNTLRTNLTHNCGLGQQTQYPNVINRTDRPRNSYALINLMTSLVGALITSQAANSTANSKRAKPMKSPKSTRSADRAQSVKHIKPAKPARSVKATSFADIKNDR